MPDKSPDFDYGLPEYHLGRFKLACSVFARCQARTAASRLVELLDEVYYKHGIDLKNDRVRNRIYEIAFDRGLIKDDIDFGFEQVRDKIEERARRDEARRKALKNRPAKVLRIIEALDKHAVFNAKDEKLPTDYMKVMRDLRPHLYFFKDPQSTKECHSCWLEFMDDEKPKRWLEIDEDDLRNYIDDVLREDGYPEITSRRAKKIAVYKDMAEGFRMRKTDSTGSTVPMGVGDIDNADDLVLDNAGYAISLTECGVVDCRLDAPMRRKLGARYDPDARCPLWMRCQVVWTGLRDARDADERRDAKDRYRFRKVKRGYTLQPHNNEHKIIMNTGRQGQGKSTILDVERKVFGDYATTFQSSKFIVKKGQHDPDPAIVFGPLADAHLAVGSDMGDKGELNAAMLKSGSGEADIETRILYHDPEVRSRKFVIELQGNVKIRPGGGVEGLERRLCLDETDIQIRPEDKDSKILEKLYAEMSGILNWMLDGLRLYNRHGWYEPDVITRKTKEYLSDFGPIIRRFVAEEFESVIGERSCTLADAYSRLIEWKIKEGYMEPGEAMPKGQSQAGLRTLLRQNHVVVDKHKTRVGEQYFLFDMKLKPASEGILDAEEKNSRAKAEQERIALAKEHAKAHGGNDPEPPQTEADKRVHTEAEQSDLDIPW